jgi:hypothetical protein
MHLYIGWPILINPRRAIYCEPTTRERIGKTNNMDGSRELLAYFPYFEKIK